MLTPETAAPVQETPLSETPQTEPAFEPEKIESIPLPEEAAPISAAPNIQQEAKLVYEKPEPKKLTQNIATDEDLALGGGEFMEDFEENLEEFDFDKDPAPGKEIKKINTQNFSNEELRNMRRSRLKDLLASQYTKPSIKAKRRENIKELLDGEISQ